ncbi:hypothetical protein CAEBREN_29552 [Caenorhabditis brenneri]|uniref:3-oxo-5-alpha-steroid 4-dehydrogenase C-terminal domain-containing protein n=1 Tax=Caenorhabditis brenneri TaxID=135651 RepID=G0N9N1_CAEBE|nr:hypothetical protein CAEBREN_29552 [Caenorhabditis brenneri]
MKRSICENMISTIMLTVVALALILIPTVKSDWPKFVYPNVTTKSDNAGFIIEKIYQKHNKSNDMRSSLYLTHHAYLLEKIASLEVHYGGKPYKMSDICFKPHFAVFHNIHGKTPHHYQNCSYYWGFAAFVAYFVNHPLFTPPAFGDFQMYLGLVGFVISEFGNLSIHILLRNLRPAGTRERRIPKPDGNPLSLLFNYVSCPNYTYEVSSWVFFTIMVQSLPALLFTLAGFVQMTIWAQGKHRNYLKEFPDYPKNRKAIVPFVL